MGEQAQTPNGTLAEEAARLIDAMASMARSGTSPNPSPYAGGPAPESESSSAPHDKRLGEGPLSSSEDTCRACGGQTNGTPVACRLCPICQGIALLRSVRPETVDRLADFATAVAASLRDMATQARVSDPGSAAGPGSGGPTSRGGANVQDILVDDEDEGLRR